MPGGRAPGPGEVFRNPTLARSLELIADGGRDAFYRGPIARAIVADLKARGGLFEERDFADHTADWVDPIATTYRGCELCEMPPSTQGFVALEMLNLMEGFDVGGMGHNSADFLHLVSEAKKLAFADRGAYLADRDAMPAGVLAALISKEYAAATQGRDRSAPGARLRAGIVRVVAATRRVAGFCRPRSRRYGVSDGRGQARQRHLADSIALCHLRRRNRRGRHGHRAAQPRRGLQSGRRGTPTKSGPTSARCTRWCRRCCSATAGRGCRSA